MCFCYLQKSTARRVFRTQASNIGFSSSVHYFDCLCSVDTGRKLNVHKTFRRRPGRFLNVLFTFNLPPVSTGLFCLTGFRMPPWHCMKCVLIRSFFWSVFSRVQTEFGEIRSIRMREIRTRKNSILGQFLRSVRDMY